MIYSSTTNMQIIDKFLLRSMLYSSSMEQEWWTRGWGIHVEDEGKQEVVGTGRGARADIGRIATGAGGALKGSRCPRGEDELG